MDATVALSHGPGPSLRNQENALILATPTPQDQAVCHGLALAPAQMSQRHS